MEHHVYTQKHHIALIGLSGTGKSTVAQMIAEQLGWTWADTDALIVAQAGRSIAEIFAMDGEQAFRELETARLREAIVAATEPLCLATGGGIILREENRALLRTHAFVVWLDAPTAVLHSRLLAHDEQRPLLAGDAPQTRIEALRMVRTPLYRALADLTIDTTGLTPEQVVQRVLDGRLPDGR